MNPGSLCARILKARYFPDVEFMQSGVPRSALATWHAIVAGRDALMCGLIKRVGDGSSISIWDDNWTPESLPLKPLFKPVGCELVKVSELIDEYNWTWKADIIRTTFIAPAADAILNIPLRNGGGDDFVAWTHDKTGVYSVKTAYRALTNRKEQLTQEEGTGTGSPSTNEQIWKTLWKLNVMPKIRVFWWRVIGGILPDEATLKRRHIKPLSRCNVCMAEEEDLMHARVYCAHAKQFWEEAHNLFF